MELKIALAGNPNCGKTTLFNALTGANQYVGNWPGVTVEKKEGKLKKHEGVTVTDLPGIYSLSPYTLEEVVARNYLIGERPDAILNLVDGTNLERNLYLTTQLTELGIPVVVAVNMMDLVKKSGDKIDIQELSRQLGCPVLEISALKGDGISEAAEAAVKAAQGGATVPQHTFSGVVEHALAHIEEAAVHGLPEEQQRWYAIKIFERDQKVLEQLKLSDAVTAHIETDIQAAEKELDDDAEAIITNERYVYIAEMLRGCYKKKSGKKMTASDRVDQIVTNRVLALPIFFVVMFLIYAIAMGPWPVSIGSIGTEWANDGLFGDGWFVPFTADMDAWEEDSGAFEEAAAIIEAYENGETEAYLYDDEEGETTVLPVTEEAYRQALTVAEPDPSDYGVWVPGIPVLLDDGLTAIHCNEIVKSLVLDGIVAGVGAVLGFVPQMLVLFFLLAILEDIGYMARIAFIMDRIFRRFGLSGKSFIPMLVATGCGVPGVMASRTIEQDRDRKMTIMTTCFMPCGAKAPIIALFAGAIFHKSPFVAASAYFIGIGSVIVSGIMLKKFKAFAGDPAPFVMELPAYHVPSAGNVLRATWERGWSFIKRAGTIILLASIGIWFLQGFGFTASGFGQVENSENSLLAAIGGAICFIFAPLGFGNWKDTVATITGLIAKEDVVGTMSILYPGNFDLEIARHFTPITTYSFMIFNLLCAPCFAAIGAIKREMNNWKWTCFAVGYMCVWAYVVALVTYQIGGLIAGEVAFNFWTVAAVALLALIGYLLFRKGYQPQCAHLNTRSVEAGKV